MTEAEWRTSEVPAKLLNVVMERSSGRKLALFALAACYLRIPQDETCRACYECVARYIEGEASREDLRRSWFDEPTPNDNEIASPEDPHRWAFTFVQQAPGNPTYYPPLEVLSDLLREVFGNPFRPVAVDPAWLTSDVLALARGIYDERAFDRMPIFADALQDAGCDNEDVLFHCRDANQVHVRGCWVLDLVLGKT